MKCPGVNIAYCVKGRVKTLHPAVHAGILSTNSESDEKVIVVAIDYAQLLFLKSRLWKFS